MDNGIFPTAVSSCLSRPPPATVMTSSSTNAPADAAICPYTLKPISSIDKSELAVINPEQSECGHKCSLPHLVSYIHDASAGSTHSCCPVCLQYKVTVACDGNAADKVLRRGHHGENDKQEQVVCLRYGPIHYYLSLQSTSPRTTATSCSCTLSRIGGVLGVDVKHGMKIIHNGKIIYPDKTNNDISEKILSISSLDIAKKRKKPSLVVIGIRKRQLYSKGSKSNAAAAGVQGIIFAIVSMLTPRALWSNMSWGIGWTINTTKSLLGGLYLFAQSMLYPPQHRDE
eukprot:scaffold3783_cov126-Skeletonema_dohrnii-CCMP3373.AAC.3